ncbi:MAG: hypothetical protein FWG50_02345 [Kiritimatiellaeota bacterium]|nr:hypothetical protein [Kiritimatiellota bacterium]
MDEKKNLPRANRRALRFASAVALAAVMLQGCAANRGQFRASMPPMEVLTLLGLPDFSERGGSEHRFTYSPQNDIPYSPVSTCLVIDDYYISTSADKGIRDITVRYTAKDKRLDDVRWGCLPEKFMPDPLPGKWGKIRAGMSREEVEALLGTSDRVFKRDFEYSFYDDIPYSSSMPDLVVYEIHVVFSGFIVESVLVWYLTPEGREERRGA